MKVKTLSPEVRHIWKVAIVVQAVRGFVVGLAIFIYVPTLYEKFAFLSNPNVALTLVGIVIIVNNALDVCFEIPTGAIGDAIGRKWAVVTSFGLNMVFCLLLGLVVVLINSLTWALAITLLAVVFYSLAYTFFSGTFTAWCVDQLRSTGPQIGYEHLLSKANTWYLLGVMMGGVLSIVLYLNELMHAP